MSDTALILIDIQNDYFEGGRLPVPGMANAAARVAKLLGYTRQRGGLIVHVRHESHRPGAAFLLPGSEGAKIHASVQPSSDEIVVVKTAPNSFRGTDLASILTKAGIRRVTLCGAMSQTCIDATARAARDLDFEVTVAADACAARPLSFGGRDVAAEDVHAAYMAALSGVYASVVPSAELMNR